MRRFNPYSTCPLKEISAQIPVGEDEAIVEVVPGFIAHLSPGYHEFEMPGSSCVIDVSVAGDY